MFIDGGPEYWKEFNDCHLYLMSASNSYVYKYAKLIFEDFTDYEDAVTASFERISVVYISISIAIISASIVISSLCIFYIDKLFY